MPSTGGCLLSLKQSRLFLSSTKAHLAVISAHLYPVIYTVFSRCFMWFYAAMRLCKEQKHIFLPFREPAPWEPSSGPSKAHRTPSGACSKAFPQPSQENSLRGSKQRGKA